MRKIVPSEALRTGWQLIHDAKNVGREEKWFNGIPEAAAVKAERPKVKDSQRLRTRGRIKSGRIT